MQRFTGFAVLFLLLSTASAGFAQGVARNEDWSSITLAGSTLKAQPPLLGERDDYPDFTRELIRVEWRAGDPIDLYVILPKQVQKAPVILYLYGFPSETDRFQNEDFCKLLAKNGFAAVGFVSALTGQRYHDRPIKEWFVSELQESIGSSVHDVEMILNYLDMRGDVDMNCVGMFGEGSGAAIAVLAAAGDSRIKAIDLLNLWGDWPDWLAKSSVVPDQERADYLKSDFLKKVERLDPVEWLSKLKIPVRLQYLYSGLSTPKAAQVRLEKSLSSQAVFVPEAEALRAYRSSSGDRFFDWIKDQARRAQR
ncbi:MAG: alpha/beta hydrolase [Acidobacteriaceae bacterium]|nr:alpha/beta hydrolase [Acidobacteriaceae bacterium]